MHQIGFEAYGVGVRVDVDADDDTPDSRFAQMVAGLAQVLPPGAVPSEDAAAATPIQVECDGTIVTVRDPHTGTNTTSSAEVALHVLDQAIRSRIAVHAPERVFVHAGVVAIDGTAIVVPGRSMAGKTTLVAALVDAGATYLSDEYAVFNSEGLVHPYPRRLSIRSDEGRRDVPVEELGGRAADGAHRVGLVAALSFDDAGWQVAEGTQAACATTLIDNAVAAQFRPTEVLSVAGTVARGTRYLEGTRGEATDATARLIELVRG